jgi:hypothetical protein
MSGACFRQPRKVVCLPRTSVEAIVCRQIQSRVERWASERMAAAPNGAVGCRVNVKPGPSSGLQVEKRSPNLPRVELSLKCLGRARQDSHKVNPELYR